MFAVVRDAVTFALLQGGLGQVLTGQPIQAREALPPPTPGGGHHLARGRTGQAGIERLAKVRATLYGRLAAIDVARKAITAIARDGDGVSTAVQVEIRHHCGVIAKQAKKARETLAGTGLAR